MISIIWIGLTIISFWLAHRKFYLSGTVFLCSTTLLVELIPGIYIWDLFFLYVLVCGVLLSDFTVKRSYAIFVLVLICFLTLNAFLAGEYFSLVEIARLIQFSIFCLFLYSHYSKNTIEAIFIYALFASLLINVGVHFFQIFRLDFGFALKPTGSITIGGLFNDSSEFGPIALLFAFIFYADSFETKSLKLLGLPVLVACFAVMVSFNRTSFMLLPVLAVATFFYSRLGIKVMVLLFIIIALPFSIGYSNKNFDLVYALLNDPSSLLGGTVELRLMNWQIIFNYYLNYCNIIFGCPPGFFDVHRYLFSSEYGVFSVDNAFLRIVVSYGVIGSVFFVLGMSYLFLKTNKYLSFWIIIFGLGMMIELFKSLPVVLVLICCFAYLLKQENQNIIKSK